MTIAKDAKTALLYLQWDEKFLTEKPYQVFVPLPDGIPEECQSNLHFALGEVEVVTDIRGREGDFTLDKNGFAVCQQNSKLENFTDAKEIERIYLPEVVELLKENVKDAEKIVIFDWRVRVLLSSIECPIVFMPELNTNRSAKVSSKLH